MKERLVVVFDVDDVLWNLNSKVLRRLGIEEEKIKFFNIKLNTELTEEEKEIILKSYADVDIFRGMDWYDGVMELVEMQKDFELLIITNCFSKEIADVKMEQLIALGFKEENIICNVISYENQKKPLPDHVDIYVEDSVDNVVRGNAKKNYILRRTWNVDKSYIDALENNDKNYTYVDTLLEVVDVLKSLL